MRNLVVVTDIYKIYNESMFTNMIPMLNEWIKLDTKYGDGVQKVLNNSSTAWSHAC